MMSFKDREVRVLMLMLQCWHHRMMRSARQNLTNYGCWRGNRNRKKVKGISKIKRKEPTHSIDEIHIYIDFPPCLLVQLPADGLNGRWPKCLGNWIHTGDSDEPPCFQPAWLWSLQPGCVGIWGVNQYMVGLSILYNVIKWKFVLANSWFFYVEIHSYNNTKIDLSSFLAFRNVHFEVQNVVEFNHVSLKWF